jgi:hypothetical protein
MAEVKNGTWRSETLKRLGTMKDEVDGELHEDSTVEAVQDMLANKSKIEAETEAKKIDSQQTAALESVSQQIQPVDDKKIKLQAVSPPLPDTGETKIEMVINNQVQNVVEFISSDVAEGVEELSRQVHSGIVEKMQGVKLSSDKFANIVRIGMEELREDIIHTGQEKRKAVTAAITSLSQNFVEVADTAVQVMAAKDILFGMITGFYDVNPSRFDAKRRDEIISPPYSDTPSHIICCCLPISSNRRA